MFAVADSTCDQGDTSLPAHTVQDRPDLQGEELSAGPHPDAGR